MYIRCVWNFITIYVFMRPIWKKKSCDFIMNSTYARNTWFCYFCVARMKNYSVMELHRQVLYIHMYMRIFFRNFLKPKIWILKFPNKGLRGARAPLGISVLYWSNLLFIVVLIQISFLVPQVYCTIYLPYGLCNTIRLLL